MSQSPNELNERIAVELFGWKRMLRIDAPARDTPGHPQECQAQLRNDCVSITPAPVPDYLGPDDYLVLERVLAKWSDSHEPLFSMFVMRVWRDRGRATNKPWMLWEHYRPGDYTRAVIAVLDQEKAKGQARETGGE